MVGIMLNKLDSACDGGGEEPSDDAALCERGEEIEA